MFPFILTSCKTSRLGAIDPAGGRRSPQESWHVGRWWQDAGWSMAISLTLYPNHDLSSYKILGMMWFFFKSDEFSSMDCFPRMWRVSCRTDGWRHVDSQIQSMLLQIIEIIFYLWQFQYLQLVYILTEWLRNEEGGSENL